MLISWYSKKQTYVTLFIVKAEYVAAASCCPQLLWIEQQLEDYGLSFDHIPIKCDNPSVICIFKNLVQHSRMKYIDVEKDNITLDFVFTDYQLTDILIKSFDETHFSMIRGELELIDPFA